MPEWVVGIIIGVVAVSGTWATAKVASKNNRYSRIKDLEHRVDKVESRGVLLWRYNFELVRHIYEGSPPPPPPLPDGLIEH